MEVTEKRAESQIHDAFLKWLRSPSRFLLLLAGYFVLQIVLRLVTSSTLDLDEAEQFVATQQLQLGYGPQPPLYTWLLFPLLQVHGPSLLVLTVFKNALLFGIYALTYSSARLLFRNPVLSALAALSLIFVPQLSWESQRDLTHSVLVTFMAVATFTAFLKLNEVRSLRWYLVFGICLGMGALSKYSYLVFATGLLIGAACVQSNRATVLNPRLLLSFAVVAVIVTPHLLWATSHADWVTVTAGKFKIAAHRPWMETTLIGIKNLLVSGVAHVAPPVLIYLVVCRRRIVPGKTAGTLPDGARVIVMSLIAMFGMLSCSVFFFKATAFKERWLLPLCIWLPILLVASFSSRLNPVRIQRLIWLCGGVALVVSILIPTRIWLVKWWGSPETLNAPFEELAPEIDRRAGPDHLVVGQNNWIAGNLKLRFPTRVVLSPNSFLDVPLRSGERCVVVWDALRSEAFPPRLFNYVNQLIEINSNDVYHVEAPMKFWPEKTLRLGFATGKVRSDATTSTLPSRGGN